MKRFFLLSLVCVLGLFGNLRAQEITIGSAESSSYRTPINTDQTYSISQQIYTATEIGQANGKISKIAFKWASSTAETRNLSIYMQNTTQSSFGNWIPVTDNDKVFDGEVNINSEWVEITFTTKFDYTGGNLLLCVYDKTGGWGNKSYFYNYATSPTAASAISAQGSKAYDPSNLSGGTQRNFNNHIKLTFTAAGAEEIKPVAPANLNAEALSDSQIVLTWDAVENALTYNVYQNDVKIAEGLTATNYTIENLEAATNYCFTVTAVNDLESDKSAEECVETEATPAAATTFVFDFNDGTKGDMRVFQGAGASHLCPNWGTPQDHSTVDLVINQLKTRYKGVDGSIAVYSMTYDVLEDVTRIPDNYIVTNKSYLITATSTVEWDIRQAEDGKSDQYSIVVSEDGTNFTDLWFEIYGDKTGETKAYSLADYAGKELYIGFHHYKQTDGGALCLDNVKLVTDSQITPEEPIDPTAPTVPDNVKAVAFSESSIKLTWNAAENTTSYNVYMGEDVVATSITETSYMVENLETGSAYCFTVTAVNAEKESAKSAEACATTFEAAPEVPAVPTNLKAEAVTDATINLTWDAVEGAKVYYVYQGIIKLVTVAEPTHLVTGLQAGKEYCFTVTAVNDGGESAKSESACATTLVDETVEKPAAPQNLTVMALVPGELTLTWDAVEGAEEYNIYGGGEYKGTLAQTSVDITELDANTQYCFTVTAVNKGGESEHSNEVCETTMEEGNVEKPAGPQNLTVMALIHNELRLTWDAVEGATKYNVYQFEELLGSISNTEVDIFDLASDTRYCFTVTAIIDGVESEPSNEACETTLSEESIVELTSSINVYPNPVNDKLYIETEEIVNEVVVYDVYGRQQDNKTTRQQGNLSVDVTNLNSGVYFVKVITNNGEVVKRFIKK